MRLPNDKLTWFVLGAFSERVTAMLAEGFRRAARRRRAEKKAEASR
jgi:hypothetical protein